MKQTYMYEILLANQPKRKKVYKQNLTYRQAQVEKKKLLNKNPELVVFIFKQF